MDRNFPDNFLRFELYSLWLILFLLLSVPSLCERKHILVLDVEQGHSYANVSMAPIF